MKALRWIRNNIDLKIWAVIIALIVWFHVATERTYDTNYTARLEFVNPPKGWTLVGNPPEEISLRLRGTGKQLISHRLYGEPLATVELPRKKSPEVPVELSPEDVLLARKGSVEIIHLISPTEFIIEMDTLVRKRVPVVPEIQNGPKEQFTTIGRPTVDPGEVELFGGRSRMRTIVELKTEPVDLRGESRTVERKVAVSLPPGAGFRSKPDSVSVLITIDRVVEIPLENLHVSVANLEPEKSATVSPRTALVRLSAPESMAGDLDTSTVRVSLDLSDLGDGPHLLPPKVTKPEHFQVRAVEPKLFSVLIE
jgi:YbbR domain-containing protein